MGGGPPCDPARQATPELVEAYEPSSTTPTARPSAALLMPSLLRSRPGAVLCDALEVLATKQDAQPARRHSNTPL